MEAEKNYMEGKKKYGWGVKAAVLAIIVTQYTMTLQTPVMGTINAAFAGQGYDFFIKQLETVNTLTMVIVGLSMSYLLKHFKKKTILIAGAIISMGELIPGFVDGFWAIFIGRAITGIGMGVIYPFAVSYIIDLFDGEEQNRMMGNRSTVGAIAGIIIIQLSGILATNYGYHASYLIAAVCIPTVLLMIAKIPETDQERALAAAKEAKNLGIKEVEAEGHKEKELTPLSLVLVFANILTMIFTYTYFTNTGIVICSPVEVGGFGLTPAVAGLVLTVMSITMAVSGVLYARVFIRFFKQYTTVLSVFLLGINFVIGYYANSVGALIVQAVFFGFGFQIYNGSFSQVLGKTVKPSAVATVTALFFALNGVGQYLSSVIVPLIVKFTRPDDLRGDWLVAFIGLLIGGVVVLALQKTAGNKNKVNAGA